MRSLMLAAVLVLFAIPTPRAHADADEARLRELVSALRSSTVKAPGGERLFPSDLAVDRVGTRDGARILYMRGSWGPGPDRSEDPRIAEVVDELRLETLLGALTAFGVRSGVEVRVSAPGGEWRKLGGARRRDAAVNPPAVRMSPRPTPRVPGGGGVLYGRRIAVSAGHGWLLKSGAWSTQRSRWDFDGCGSCRGITEDFFNAELVSNQLIPLLQGMGAEVVLVRDPDLSVDAPVIVDDGDTGFREAGSWSAGTSAGGFGDDYRTSAPGSGGEAWYDAAFARAGRRHVYLRYLDGSNRTPGAVAEVRHAGGSTLFDLDQTRRGTFWLDLGAFWFSGPGSLGLTNGGSGYLIADAVRFGAGAFADSGKPWWEMAAASYVPWAGAPSTVTSAGDVTIRPLYAEHIGADVYVAVHGNASGVSGGSAVNGTSTYRYSCQMYADYTRSDSAAGCDDPPGSKALIDLVQGSIIRRVRADWDPNWGDRGKIVANFGELRELAGIPGVLVETAFFDNVANPSGSPPPKYPDNRSMHDPRWREAVAQGIAEGVAAFLSPGAGAPPARPDGLRAINLADGTLEVAWRAVPGALGYRVSMISGPRIGAGRDRAFDAGRVVSGTRLVLGNLAPRELYAFRVSAFDANGEGYPSQVVVARFRGARNAGGPSAEALVVSAYDRRDAWVQDVDNDFGYAVEHGQALAAIAGADVFFDGALDEAVEDGTVPLAGYRLVDYGAGKDSTEHEAISTAMQGLLAAYLASGGALVVSGEEVGYDLVDQGSATDKAFVDQTLGAGYLADSASASRMAAVAGGPFDGIGEVDVDDGTRGVYRVLYPDVLEAKAGVSTVALTWPDGRAAAVASAKVLFFGAPLEAVVPAPARATLFERAVGHLAPGIAKGDLDLDGASDACEEQYGFDPRDGSDGAQDADGDGVSNAAECRAGTDPGRGGFDWDGGVGPDASEPLDAWTRPPGRDAGPADAEGIDASRPDAGADAQVAAGPDAEVARFEPVEVHGGCGCTSGGGEPAVLFGFLALMLARVPLSRDDAKRRSGRGPG